MPAAASSAPAAAPLMMRGAVTYRSVVKATRFSFFFSR